LIQPHIGISLCASGCPTFRREVTLHDWFARRSHPEQALHPSSARVMVERSSALVKTACMPRLPPPETLAIEVMAELVTESAEECAEGGDLFPDRGPHPETYEQGFGMVVPEQFNSGTAFSDSKRAGCKHSDPGLPNEVETRSKR